MNTNLANLNDEDIGYTNKNITNSNLSSPNKKIKLSDNIVKNIHEKEQELLFCYVNTKTKESIFSKTRAIISNPVIIITNY